MNGRLAHSVASVLCGVQRGPATARPAASPAAWARNPRQASRRPPTETLFIVSIVSTSAEGSRLKPMTGTQKAPSTESPSRLPSSARYGSRARLARQDATSGHTSACSTSATHHPAGAPACQSAAPTARPPSACPTTRGARMRWGRPAPSGRASRRVSMSARGGPGPGGMAWRRPRHGAAPRRAREQAGAEGVHGWAGAHPGAGSVTGYRPVAGRLERRVPRRRTGGRLQRPHAQ